jgi:hypothetical protein
MTQGRWFAGLLLGTLAAFILGFSTRIIVSGLPDARGGDGAELETSSIDLVTGGGEATLGAHGMVPGDSVTAAVTVANSGSEPIAYTMSHGVVSAGGAALAAALILTIRSVGSSCADFDGTVLFDGPLNEAAIGSQSNARPLAAATAEILCLRTAMPLAAGNGHQGAATNVTLSFSVSSDGPSR